MEESSATAFSAPLATTRERRPSRLSRRSKYNVASAEQTKTDRRRKADVYRIRTHASKDTYTGDVPFQNSAG